MSGDLFNDTSKEILDKLVLDNKKLNEQFDIIASHNRELIEKVNSYEAEIKNLQSDVISCKSKITELTIELYKQHENLNTYEYEKKLASYISKNDNGEASYIVHFYRSFKIPNSFKLNCYDDINVIYEAYIKVDWLGTNRLKNVTTYFLKNINEYETFTKDFIFYFRNYINLKFTNKERYDVSFAYYYIISLLWYNKRITNTDFYEVRLEGIKLLKKYGINLDTVYRIYTLGIWARRTEIINVNLIELLDLILKDYKKSDRYTTPYNFIELISRAKAILLDNTNCESDVI
jgi:hypothetical protein